MNEIKKKIEDKLSLINYKYYFIFEKYFENIDKIKQDKSNNILIFLTIIMGIISITQIITFLNIKNKITMYLLFTFLIFLIIIVLLLFILEFKNKIKFQNKNLKENAEKIKKEYLKFKKEMEDIFQKIDT